MYTLGLHKITGEHVLVEPGTPLLIQISKMSEGDGLAINGFNGKYESTPGISVEDFTRLGTNNGHILVSQNLRYMNPDYAKYRYIAAFELESPPIIPLTMVTLVPGTPAYDILTSTPLRKEGGKLIISLPEGNRNTWGKPTAYIYATERELVIDFPGIIKALRTLLSYLNTACDNLRATCTKISRAATENHLSYSLHYSMTSAVCEAYEAIIDKTVTPALSLLEEFDKDIRTDMTALEFLIMLNCVYSELAAINYHTSRAVSVNANSFGVHASRVLRIAGESYRKETGESTRTSFGNTELEMSLLNDPGLLDLIQTLKLPKHTPCFKEFLEEYAVIHDILSQIHNLAHYQLLTIGNYPSILKA